jgi:hypothetical protein
MKTRLWDIRWNEIVHRVVLAKDASEAISKFLIKEKTMTLKEIEKVELIVEED